MTRRDELIALCRKYRVRRLDVFGSAARDDFDEQSSDIDLLIEFDDMPYADRGDAYLGFLMEAEALLGHHVDLVEVGAVRNPYVRHGIEASRRLLFNERPRASRPPHQHHLNPGRRGSVPNLFPPCSQSVPKKT